MNFFNLHTHNLNCDHGIISLFPEQLNEITEGKKYSMGIHPWHVNEKQIDNELEIIESLAKQGKILAIGECGLDKIKGIEMEKQISVLKHQIEISDKYNLPLILHCVKAFDELIQLKKESKSTQRFIIHGFKGGRTQTRQLEKQGFYFSFGKALMDNNAKVSESLKSIDKRHFFLETDVSEIPIEKVYRKAAEILGVSIEILVNLIERNRMAVFVTGY